MSLYITVTVGDKIEIGDAVVTFNSPANSRIRVCIDAHKDILIKHKRMSATTQHREVRTHGKDHSRGERSQSSKEV